VQICYPDKRNPLPPLDYAALLQRPTMSRPRKSARTRLELAACPDLRKDLDGMLLRLHAASTPDELWKAVEPIALCLTGSAAGMMSLSIISLRPQRLWSTGDHHRCFDHAAMARLLANRFIPDYLARFPGTEVFSAGALFPDFREWRETEFYQEFFAPFGWDDHCGFFVFEDGAPVAALGLMRRAEHGDYTSANLAALDWLLGHFKVACKRVTHGERMRAALAEMETRFGGLFEPGVFLDWSLRVVSANRGASESVAKWNGDGIRSLCVGMGADDLPPQLQTILFDMRTDIETALRDHQELPDIVAREVYAPADPGTKATARALLRTASSHGLPMFHIQFASTSPSAPLREAWTEVGLVLSAAEKQIVRLVCAGQSNKAIADSLGKSPETVKRQLSTSYQKLGVNSRAQLMARLGMLANGGIDDPPL
jgi:DNA-binding CsgD family transcriptional regulator